MGGVIGGSRGVLILLRSHCTLCKVVIDNMVSMLRGFRTVNFCIHVRKIMKSLNWR